MLSAEVAVMNEGVEYRPAVLVLLVAFGYIVLGGTDYASMKEATRWRRFPVLQDLMSETVNDEVVCSCVLAHHSQGLGIAVLHCVSRVET